MLFSCFSCFFLMLFFHPTVATTVVYALLARVCGAEAGGGDAALGGDGDCARDGSDHGLDTRGVLGGGPECAVM